MYEQMFSTGESYDVKIAPDERSLLSVAKNGVELWDVATGTRVHARRSPSVGALDFSPDGTRVLASMQNGACALLDPVALEEGARHPARRLKLSPGAQFVPDGTQYVQIGWQGDLVVRHAEDGEILLHERDEGRILDCLTCTPDRTLFAWTSSASDDLSVWVRHWPFTEHEPREVIRLSGGHPRASDLAVDPHGRIALRQPYRLLVWEDGECVASRPAESTGTRNAVTWLPDGELLGTDRDDRSQCALRLSAGLETQGTLPLPYACAVACSASGSMIAIGSWERGAVLRRRT